MGIKIAVLVITAVKFIYNLALDIAKYRSANNPTPETVSDVYDGVTYEKWKKYMSEYCRLDVFTSAMYLVANLVLLGANVYSSFAMLFPTSEFMQIFAVILLDTAVSTVVDIISGYIETMVIEEKYGFNKSTIKTFIIDKIRGVVLGLLLNIGLAYIIRAAHWITMRCMDAMSLGTDNLIVSGFIMTAFMSVSLMAVILVINFLYPLFSRMGNKFTPLEDGELKDRLTAMLTKHGYKIKAIEVMDASRRTTKVNAYFVGFGKLKRIVLYDNLLNTMSNDEICAIFAHEMGHGINKDIIKGYIANFVNIFSIAAAAFFTVTVTGFYTQFGFSAINYGFTGIILGAIVTVVMPFTAIFTNYRSRRAEYRADRQAVAEGYGEAMITAFKKLAKENFSNLSPSRLNVILEYSHPPLDKRVEAVMKAIEEKKR